MQFYFFRARDARLMKSRGAVETFKVENRPRLRFSRVKVARTNKVKKATLINTIKIENKKFNIVFLCYSFLHVAVCIFSSLLVLSGST